MDTALVQWPPSEPTPTTSRPSKRAKATIACLNCRVKKIKCDAEEKEGPCSPCVGKGNACCLPGPNQFRVLSDNFPAGGWSFGPGQSQMNPNTPIEIQKLEADIHAMVIRLTAIAYYLSQDYHGGHFAQFKKFNVTPDTLEAEATKLEKRFEEACNRYDRYRRGSSPSSAGSLSGADMMGLRDIDRPATPPTSSDEWEAAEGEDDELTQMMLYYERNGIDFLENGTSATIFQGFLPGMAEGETIPGKEPHWKGQDPSSGILIVSPHLEVPSNVPSNVPYLLPAPTVPSQNETLATYSGYYSQQLNHPQTYHFTIDHLSVDRPLQTSHITQFPCQVSINIADLKQINDIYEFLTVNDFFADQERVVPDSRQQGALVFRLPRNSHLSREFGRETRIPLLDLFKNLDFHSNRQKKNAKVAESTKDEFKSSVIPNNLLLDLIGHCINVFFSCKNRYAPIIHRATFEKYYRSLGRDVAQSALVMSMCACVVEHALNLHPNGPASIAHLKPKVKDLAKYFFHWATVLVKDDMFDVDDPSLNTIYALCFTADLCMTVMHIPDLGRVYHASAIRMAQGLRVYDYAAPLRNNNNNLPGEPQRRSRGEPLREKQIESELRKRLWWYLHTQDYNYAEDGARPILVFNEEDESSTKPARGASSVGAPAGATRGTGGPAETSFSRNGQIPRVKTAEIMPKPLEGEDDDTRRCLEFWKVEIKLFDVQKQIMKQLYSGEKAKVDYESSEIIGRLESMIIEWHKTIPESLLESSLKNCTDPRQKYWYHQLQIDLNMTWIEVHRTFFLAKNKLGGSNDLSNLILPTPGADPARAQAHQLERIRAQLDKSYQVTTSAMAQVLAHCARINENAEADRGLGGQLYCHFPLFELTQVCELYIAMLDAPVPTARRFDHAHALVHGYSESAEEDPAVTVARMKREAVEKLKDAIRCIKRSVHYSGGTQNHRVWVKRLTEILQKKGEGVGAVRGIEGGMGMGIPMAMGMGVAQPFQQGEPFPRGHYNGEVMEDVL